MKFLRIAIVIAALAACVWGQTTEINYQGQLQNSSAAANGSFDFEFTLFDGGGSQIGPTLTRSGVTVTGGVFTVSLDFGSGFPGATRFLEIRVRQSGGGAFTTLSPRQPVTSAPYAIKSLTANSADSATNATTALTANNFSGNLAGDVTGTQTTTRVVRLQNQNVASTPPIDGQVLKFNSATNQWLPGTDNVGGGGGGGTITGVTPGTGLTGGGTTGNVTVGIGAGGVGTGQLAEGSVVDSKIVTVSGAKVTGSVASAANVTGVVAIANGGTGSSTRNFVDLTSTESVGGSKTFTSPVNTATQYNIGGNRVFSVAGSNNLFAGLNAGGGGISNAFFGANAGSANSAGNQNTFVGAGTGVNNSTGSSNSFFGMTAGQLNTVGEYNTAIGTGANLNAGDRVFATVIGANAGATGNDQIVLGKVAGTYFVNGANTSRPADTVRIPGDLVVLGTLTAPIEGSTITNLNANNIASGTLSNARLGQIATANIADSAVTGAKIGGGHVVKTLNGLTDNVTLAAGSNISITPSGNTLTIASTGGGSGVTGSGTAGQITLWNGTSSLGVAQISQSAGNIGIGTTVAPTERLTVQTPTSSYGLVHTDNVISVGSFVGGTTNGGWYGTKSNHPLSFFTNNGVARLTITTSGDVGIGVTGPAAKLHVDGSSSTGVFANGSIGITGQGTNRAVQALGIGAATAVFAASASGAGVITSSAAQGGVALLTAGTSFFKGDTTPLSVANVGSGTGIAIGTSGALGYISAYDYGANAPRVLLLNNSGGLVGIGTNNPVQTLDVFGDVRIGTGTTGCLGDRDGTVIAGVCSSDRRFKRDIRPFGNILHNFSKLRPVNFYWRSEEFAEKHFGAKPSFGLIAQEVEEVFPDLVSTDDKGYKAINYSKLPLLTIQAVNEQQIQIETQQKQIEQQQRQAKTMLKAIKEQQATIVEQQTQLNEMKKSIACLSRKKGAACRSVK